MTAQTPIFGFSGLSGHDRTHRVRIVAAASVFLAFIGVATIGYYVIRSDYTLLDALYMTVITITTAGHREVGERALGPAGQGWTIFVLAGGITSGAVVMSLVVAALIEGRVRRVLGRRQLERQIASISGHVIVCGYGRMGSMVARDIATAGQAIVVVDVSPERTTQAEADGLLYMLGDAEEESVLLAAGVERAIALVAALPDDAANVFVTLSARGLNAQMRVIARAQEATTQDKLVRAGASRVVCPQIIGANRVVDVLLRPALVDFVELAHRGVDLEMDELTLKDGCGMVGKTLRDLSLPSRVGAMVVAVRHPDGTALYNPKPDVSLSGGDTLILIGQRGVAAAIEALEGQADAPG